MKRVEGCPSCTGTDDSLACFFCSSHHRLSVAAGPLVAPYTDIVVGELLRLTVDASRMRSDLEAARAEGAAEVARAFWVATCEQLAVEATVRARRAVKAVTRAAWLDRAGQLRKWAGEP